MVGNDRRPERSGRGFTDSPVESGGLATCETPVTAVLDTDLGRVTTG
jgi:hypothetical protein